MSWAGTYTQANGYTGPLHLTVEMGTPAAFGGRLSFGSLGVRYQGGQNTGNQVLLLWRQGMLRGTLSGVIDPRTMALRGTFITYAGRATQAGSWQVGPQFTLPASQPTAPAVAQVRPSAKARPAVASAITAKEKPSDSPDSKRDRQDSRDSSPADPSSLDRTGSGSPDRSSPSDSPSPDVGGGSSPRPSPSPDRSGKDS
jgi:hypothetical protein